ncbi:hypothetical protein DID80_01525 [Candidatus Marinamargulisbacteria bacterium SCGC AAA071-K20]|nr:hypothetical protein DID80_01525 [Candidatus Marinamargulisbacteria bacterium SCGC AAA071-K20]
MLNPISNNNQKMNNPINDFYNKLLTSGDEKTEEADSNSWSFAYESFSFQATLKNSLTDLAQNNPINTQEADANSNLAKVESNEQISEADLPELVKSLVMQGAKLMSSINSISTDNLFSVTQFQRIVKSLLSLVEDYGSFDALESISEIKGLVDNNPLASGTISKQFQIWFSSSSISFKNVKDANPEMSEQDLKLVKMTMRYQLFQYLETFNENDKNTELLESIKDTDAYQESADHFSNADTKDVLDNKTIGRAISFAKTQSDANSATDDDVPFSEIESSQLTI